jgi:hypothetical protein
MLRALGFALAVLLFGAAPAAALVPADWLGVVVDGPLTDPAGGHEAEWDRIAGSGAAGVRTAVYWSQGQPSGPGAVDFSAYDGLVLAAAARGLSVLPVVHGTPAWAAADPGNPGSAPRDGAELGRFLTALVGRYGPRGSLWDEHPDLARRPIRDWQLWNEPNFPRYWSTRPFARSYVRVLRASRRALRRADRCARLILAGLPNRSWRALRSIYRAGGRRAFDAVALHPYTGHPRDVVRIVRLARREMRRGGDRRKPVWVTELSWPAAEGKTQGTTGFETSERGQARRLREALERLATARRRLRIERVYWYTWLSAEGGENSFNWSGLRRLRGGRVVSAPALKVFRRTARRLRR